MRRRTVFRVLVPGLLIPLSLGLFAFSLPWTRGSNDPGNSVVHAVEGIETTPSPQPAMNVLKEENDVVQWWTGVATATAPTPTPVPTIEPPSEVAAAELPYAVPPQGVAYGPDERWIAVDVTTQRAYAFIGGKAVYEALVTTGRPGFETKPGDYRINYRKQNETMDSETIGIPRDDPLGYYLTNVLWTQYFYPTVALHDNYWQPISVFGHVASSHGCVGMLEDDAKWFWDFATIGTRVVVYQ